MRGGFDPLDSHSVIEVPHLVDVDMYLNAPMEGSNPRMPHDVKLLDDISIIQVEVYGRVSVEDFERSIEAIQKIWKKKGVDRVLVDARQDGTIPGLVELLGLAAMIPSALKYALLVVESGPRFRKMRFIENVAHTRGVQMQVFTSESAAFDWLLEQTDDVTMTAAD